MSSKYLHTLISCLSSLAHSLSCLKSDAADVVAVVDALCTDM